MGMFVLQTLLCQTVANSIHFLLLLDLIHMCFPDVFRLVVFLICVK